MSHHDPKLITAARNVRRRKSLFQMMLKGSKDITLSPTIPNIKLGTVADDWRSVGRDLKTAMNALNSCD